MKRVLIFVLSAEMSPYPELRTASKLTWDLVPLQGTQTFYYTASDHPIVEPKTIGFLMPDGLHEMGRKNLRAFEWALRNHRNWDFMARPNASTYVSKRRLLDHIQALPDKGLFQGVGAPRDGGTYLWGGIPYVISRDVVQAIVNNGNKWNHRDMEDQSMSQLVQELGFPLNTDGFGCSINKRPNDWLCLNYGGGKMGGFEFNNFAEFAAKNTSHFIRVKQDLQREKDVEIMRELYRNGV